GFRCLAAKQKNSVELRGKSGKSLSRYFPEMVEAFAALEQKGVILDGELIIEINGELSFDALQMRLHPAASRIARLSRETPATFVAFDCLTDGSGRPITQLPFSERRLHLERILKPLKQQGSIRLTDYTRDRRVALRWLRGDLAATDGVVAKHLDLDYRFGERAMIKVKRMRSADCVVGGFRYEQERRVVGSLLLGLFDDAGLLHHVGFTSSIAET